MTDFAWELEDGTGSWQLENGSGNWLLEEQPSHDVGLTLSGTFARADPAIRKPAHDISLNSSPIILCRFSVI